MSKLLDNIAQFIVIVVGIALIAGAIAFVLYALWAVVQLILILPTSYFLILLGCLLLYWAVCRVDGMSE